MSSKPQHKTSQIEKNVMVKVSSGEAKMKPQSYYLAVGFLGVLTVILLGSISAYAISIATLWLRIEAAQGPAYGARNNLSNLFSLFPWWTLIVGLASLTCMILLVKKIGSLYKIRLVYLILSIVFLLVAIGYLLSFSSLPGMFGGQRYNPSCSVDDFSCRPSGMGYYRSK